MRERFEKALLALSFLPFFLVSLPAQRYYKELTYPKLRDIRIPEVQQTDLDNGIKLFLLEDHELPLINVSGLVRVGSIYEPADKLGLATITGAVMRTGGSVTRSGDGLDELLEGIAASVETSIGRESGRVSMSVLKKDLETGLTVLADILMNPGFPEEKIQLAKIGERSAIARRNDSVGSIASREFRKLIYGAKSPYARHAEYETIDNISLDDLVAFHSKYFHPNNLMLAVWGDFDTEEMTEKIKKTFQGWEPQEIKWPDVPEVNYQFRQTVNFIQKDDVNQTNIYLGHIGGLRNDPDYFAILLMNRVLGSGFTSRLFREIRSRQGLAYSVFGAYTAEFDHPGVLYVGCQTKSQTTVKAIDAMMKEVKKMTQSEVTDEELGIAKDGYLNSFVFNFDSKGEIVNRLMTFAYYGYPLDFLEKVKRSVEQVTKTDILRVARKHLRADQMQILAVGRAEDLDQPLSDLGSVNEIDVSIPEPKDERPAATATAESRVQGRKLLQRSAAASGTSSIENYIFELEMTFTGPQGQFQLDSRITFLAPDRMEQILMTPMGEMRRVMAGDEAWMVGAQGVMPMPESERKEMRASLSRDLVNILRQAESDSLDVHYLGDEVVNGTEVHILLITSAEGDSSKLLVDSESFLPVKQVYRGRTPAGPTDMEVYYSDIREVSGSKVPFQREVKVDGERFAFSKLVRAEFNTSIDPATFERQ